MADYTITFARSARKELENLPANITDRILRKIEALAEHPRLPAWLSFKEAGISDGSAWETIAWFIR